ncbi:uncharacterized protein [Triticum aestivum]|uniref:uncharacterized protein n=1 Tax=Triticum aestivum TaxID=4565 RepID=UPI001D02181E|nr:uncharacterized protein LOC123094029 [Triticum aestivum]XP_044384346.1 uncharacterized protein LOC123106185 [Triticum aestivum]
MTSNFSRSAQRTRICGRQSFVWLRRDAWSSITVQVVARIIWTICRVTLPLYVFLPLTTSNYSRKAWRTRICGHPSFIQWWRDASSRIWLVVNPVLVGNQLM